MLFPDPYHVGPRHRKPLLKNKHKIHICIYIYITWVCIGDDPHESLNEKHNEYHGYTVGGTAKCPLNHHGKKTIPYAPWLWKIYLHVA